MSMLKTSFITMAALMFTGSVVAHEAIEENTKISATHNAEKHTYDRHGLIATTERLFGDASSGMAGAIEDAVAKHGKPNGYIVGEEVSAAFFGGVRYGRGVLTRKHADGTEEAMELHWQGPSAGYDFGASAAKSFFLVYDLKESDDILQRFPAVDGNFYLGPGVGVTYKRMDGITLVPVRAGLGLRGGANVGYVHFTREASWIPF
ncbi:MAG: DUF1134 domain-containing protein [Rhodospirillaceae bacterium]|nr:DUF1134 domain-containing protein [Rhodospirillaceae bacterium]